MIVAINYADDAYRKHQQLNSVTAKKIGRVDKVINYGPNDIDKKFQLENAEILNIKRGNGLWIWKPYFIHKGLNSINTNEYLIYTDSATLYVKNIAPLLKKMENVSQDVMLFDLPFIEKQWTSESVFEKLSQKDEKTIFTTQRSGTIIIIKKTEFSERFVKEWLLYCTDLELLSGFPKRPSLFFVQHREDQSILSVLSKKHNIKSFSDPTDYGKVPFNYMYFDCCYIPQHYEQNFKIENVYFLHHRGYNIFLYYIKFLIRRLFVPIVYRPKHLKIKHNETMNS